MRHKKKRQQPKPKKKKVKNSHKSRMSLGNQQLRQLGEKIQEVLKDKEHVNASITEHISQVEEYFKRYDTIQLLGSVGLYLIDNLPNMEKYFMAGVAGKQLKLDEDAEVIAEYLSIYS